MTGTLTILGCGDSGGVPRVGNNWGKCDPENPKNRRTRPCIAVQNKDTTVIVDSGVDFSSQLSREKIKTISAILYTHSHSDHVNGIDDLRYLYLKEKKRVALYADDFTYKELLPRFEYIFKQKSEFYPSVVEYNELKDEDFGTEHHIDDVTFVPFLQEHGPGVRSLGFRFGDVGYSTDMVNLDDAAIKTLQGVKVWIADCSDYHRTECIFHSNLETLQRLNAKIGADKVLFTHLRHLHDYETLKRECPEGYQPAYDGMKISLDGQIIK